MFCKLVGRHRPAGLSQSGRAPLDRTFARHRALSSRGSAAQPRPLMFSDLEKRIELLANRITVLRDAVRLNDFRLAQRLRMALVAYVKDIEGPLRDDIVQLFEITGFWLRNVDNR